VSVTNLPTFLLLPVQTVNLRSVIDKQLDQLLVASVDIEHVRMSHNSSAYTRQANRVDAVPLASQVKRSVESVVLNVWRSTITQEHL